MSLSRRDVLAGALVLAGCGAAARPDADEPRTPLKALAPFPIGVAATGAQFGDARWAALARREFDRVTPEWEMKSEAFGPDGRDLSRAHALSQAARASDLTVHGHTLVWYAQAPAFLAALDARPAFARAFDAWTAEITGRLAPGLTGLDLVNEPVDDEGELRPCLWLRNLGPTYVERAFRAAAEAAPSLPLFLNDYDLENRPRKRLGFLRLAESLLKSGAPLAGLGTQTHVRADLPAGRIRDAVRDLASLGLLIHVSELDVSARIPLSARRAASLDQAAMARGVETVEAILEIAPARRYGLTVWGLRHGDSWLNRPPEARVLADRPVLFDDEGRLSPAGEGVVTALGAARPQT